MVEMSFTCDECGARESVTVSKEFAVAFGKAAVSSYIDLGEGNDDIVKKRTDRFKEEYYPHTHTEEGVFCEDCAP